MENIFDISREAHLIQQLFFSFRTIKCNYCQNEIYIAENQEVIEIRNHIDRLLHVVDIEKEKEKVRQHEKAIKEWFPPYSSETEKRTIRMPVWLIKEIEIMAQESYYMNFSKKAIELLTKKITEIKNQQIFNQGEIDED